MDDLGLDITHIYSYNKVMSIEDTEGIASILNKTNYKVLAWYHGPKDTHKSGLRDFIYMGRMPMSSTGGERFSAYVYFKSVKYVKGIEKIWSQYDDESDDEASCDDDNEIKSGDDSSPILLQKTKSSEPNKFQVLSQTSTRSNRAAAAASNATNLVIGKQSPRLLAKKKQSGLLK